MDVTSIGLVEKLARAKLKILWDAKGHSKYIEAPRYLLNKEVLGI